MAGNAAMYAGLMSGTSMDGVDAVLIDTVDGVFRGVRAHHSLSYAPALRDALLDLSLRTPAICLADYARLDAAVAETFAAAALALLREADVLATAVTALGSHGQTVFHQPAGAYANTLQLGDPARIALRTGITTVADFRRGDIAAGGQGAPLAPGFHHAAFASAAESRCVVNLGGIANVTLLPDIDPQRVRGYDTGPANGLMDEWMQRHRGQSHDADGGWARSGQLHTGLLEAMIADPYFSAAAPKSSGRDYFNLDWLQRRYPTLDALPPADVQRTLCELTAATVATAARGAAAQRLLLSGGGSANGFLVERLRAHFAGAVSSVADYGVLPMQVEGAAFAWLAMRRLQQLPGNLPAVTGASRALVLGGVFSA